MRLEPPTPAEADNRMKPLQLFGSNPTIWLTLEKLTQQVIWLLLFLVLAPILGPKPYGLLAIVMAFVGFCEIVIVGAAAEALVIVPNLTDGHLRTANLIAVLAAVIAGMLTFAAAPEIGAVFDAPDLVPLFRVLAPLPLISALTVGPTAILTRQMRFRAFALRSIVGLLAGGSVALYLAWEGSGVWALVAQILVQRCVEVALLWGSARTPLGFEWSRNNFQDLRGYAISVGVSRSMAWFGGQIPRVILGWYLGPTDLGLFALAAKTVDFVVQVFVVPQVWISRLNLRRYADEPDGFAEAFQLNIRQIAILVFPVCCGLAAIMPTLFAAFLDQRWTAGVVPAQIMMLTAIPATFYYCFTAAVLAARQPHLDSRMAIATDSTTALAVLLVASYGLYAACLAMLAQRILLMPALFIMLRRVTGISIAQAVWAQLPILGAAAVMGWIVVLVTSPIQRLFYLPLTPLILIAMGGIVYAPLAFAVAPDIVRILCMRIFTKIRTNTEPV
jgi:O-antigen/teichoic acid export membrane protein